LWFQDEGRFGLQGTISRVWALKGKRAYASKQTDFEWVYVFGVVCPATGQTHSCLISFADTSAMNGYLKDFSKQFPSNEHVLMMLYRAGWHRSKALRIAENLTLLLLSAYSPELNPVELLWRQMRDKHLWNQVFETAEQLDRGLLMLGVMLLAIPKPSVPCAFFLGLDRLSITKIGISDTIKSRDHEIALAYIVYVEIEPTAKFYDKAAFFNLARQF
jgi:hypothetical protein